VEASDQLTCIICTQPVSLAEATAGSMTVESQQAFAHESHRANRAVWLFHWLRFQDLRGLYTSILPATDYEAST
jgi:hypothetical protein